MQCSLKTENLSEDEDVRLVVPQNENCPLPMENDSQFQQSDTGFEHLSSYTSIDPLQITTSTSTQLNECEKIMNSNSGGIQNFPLLGIALSSSDTFDSHELNTYKIDSQNFSENNEAHENPGQYEVQIKEELDIP